MHNHTQHDIKFLSQYYWDNQMKTCGCEMCISKMESQGMIKTL